MKTAMVWLMQVSLLSSITFTLPVYAQDKAPLSVNLASDTPERKPGEKPDPKTLEGGLWAETAKVEQAAKTSGERNADPALNSYVAGVETRIAGPFAGDVRVYVMDRPFFNASTAPNGYTEVWSGLLLRCQTEDELAFVLGHEAGHFRHSHVLKTYQAMKDGQNAAMAASILLAVVAMGAAMNANSYQAINNINSVTRGLIDITYLGTIAALMNYSRETEGQADAYGMIYAHRAGYFTGASQVMWQERLNETAASDYDKVRKSPTRINVFGDHPLEADRITALAIQDKELNGGKSSLQSEADAKAARTAYRDHVRPYLAAWLKDDLRRQDYGQTLYVLGRLSVDGQDAGLLNYYKGEAFRMRGTDADLKSALAAYQAAADKPDAPKETNRQMGDVYRRMGDIPSAISAFQAYVAGAPNASDAWMVQDEIETLQKAPPVTPTSTQTPTETKGTTPATPTSGGTT